ncbi:N-formylglutamate amidohydrolase [Pseudooceanicola sp. MF1-13]|uniref:N-formylglutamate amidohydrolase n=1 Tax=Pseudooceanicola sp. MF1-13 TaxID=3379095 RepID=UPI00389121AE
MQADWTAVTVTNPEGAAPVVLVCEHASCDIPADLDGLGLSEKARTSHAAWDIGAADMAIEMARLLDAPLVAAGVSRLVYDLNRPLDSKSAIPETSEIFDIPGNRGLSEVDRRDRFDRLHTPFHVQLADTVAAQQARVGGPVALITIHTFTPVFFGKQRAVEIGYLFHANGGLAKAALKAEGQAGRYKAALNEPYAATDGVTHTLRMQGEDHGLPSLMIEVRNDLVDTPESARAMAAHLVEVLVSALKGVADQQEAAE